MKNTPGPRAPPDSRRPSLKMTALSYSWSEKSKSNRDESFNSSTPHWDRGSINKMSFAGRQSGYKIASLGGKNARPSWPTVAEPQPDTKPTEKQSTKLQKKFF